MKKKLVFHKIFFLTSKGNTATKSKPTDKGQQTNKKPMDQRINPNRKLQINP